MEKVPLPLSGMSKYFSAANFAADADDRDDRSEASASRSAVTDLTDDDLSLIHI